MKKLLMYVNYYYPEVASIAQLYTDLCQGLKNEYDITVICSIPCYTEIIEKKYLEKKYFFEEYEGIKVIRVRVPQFNKKNKTSRIKHILAYFFHSITATFKVGQYDYVFAVSQPPILGGMLGTIGKAIGRLSGRQVKLIYNIQDFNPEQTRAVGYSKSGLILSAMMFFDKISCTYSDKVIVVGRDMIDTMRKRFMKKNGSVSHKMPVTVFINNWIDQNEIYPLPKSNKQLLEFKKKYGLLDKFVVMYSGNIGLFYDLDHLIQIIERFKDNQNMVFAFVGEGVLKERLQEYCMEHQMHNVLFIPYQKKEELIFSLNAADVHWVVNASGIKGVSCPSKLYGVLAVGKMVLGVLEEDTEARRIIEMADCGYVVSPKDYEGIYDMIKRSFDCKEKIEVLGNNGRKYLEKNLTKEFSIKRYLEELNI